MPPELCLLPLRGLAGDGQYGSADGSFAFDFFNIDTLASIKDAEVSGLAGA
jgi:hypothetical protein